MNDNKKAIVRQLFQLKIHKANGQSFEDLFTMIMNYINPEFQQIKPWGNIGDCKNDGYIPSQGKYFQVYAPEDLRRNLKSAVNKLKTDFSGLLDKWDNVKEYYFVVNDKYRGVPPQLSQVVQEIANKHNIKAEIWKANNLEDLVFSLDDDKIEVIVGGVPDPQAPLRYDLLNEVIEHLMRIDISSLDSDVTYPDWDKKIQFNNLSEMMEEWLRHGSLQVFALDEYLNNQSNFYAEEVKQRIRKIYIDKKDKFSGDDLFIQIMDEISPRSEGPFQGIAIIIMAKYFEICEIFEEPK